MLDDPRQAAASMNQIRVAIVTTSFPVQGNPYSGIFVNRLVAHLPSSIKATVLFPCPDSEYAVRRDGNDRHDLVCFRYGPQRWQRLAHRPGGIPDALRRRDPALLLLPLLLLAMFINCVRLAGKVDVMHGNWSVPGLIAAVAARLRGRPAVVTLRGSDVSKINESRWLRIAMVACLALNHRVVAVSESMREFLSAEFPRWASRIIFLSDGAASGAASETSEMHTPLRLLTVCNLVRSKRVDTLIQAIVQLPKDIGATLRIVGDGPERAHLESIASQLGTHRKVEFVGSVLPDEVMAHLAWADIFLFASESEGRPNAILEAMAASLPVIAADIPGVRELVHKDCGILVPVGGASDFAHCIQQLWQNRDQAAAMGRNAKAKIERDGLSWREAAQRYADLYHTLDHLGSPSVRSNT